MLPRLGVSMHLDRSMEHVRYFGRGPGENYPDSKEAGLMGVYENTIDGLFTNYVVPQSNGNHMDCKWVLQMTEEWGLWLPQKEVFSSVLLSMKKKIWKLQSIPVI